MATSSQPVAAHSTASRAKIPEFGTPTDRSYYLSAGLQQVKHQKYIGLATFRKAIEAHMSKLLRGNIGLHIAFAPVTQQHLTSIEEIRGKHHKGLRFMYWNDEQTLIVKISPGLAYEVAKCSFLDLFSCKLLERKLQRELFHMGAVKFLANDSSNEGDDTWRPRARPGRTSWPTIVFECGAPESLDRLRVNAQWWIEKSARAVKIVILLSISESERSLHIEKWEMVEGPNGRNTRSDPHRSQSQLRMTHQVDIKETIITGGPLIIDFRRLFLRQPVTGEEDIVLTLEDLEDYAEGVWNTLG